MSVDQVRERGDYSLEVTGVNYSFQQHLLSVALSNDAKQNQEQVRKGGLPPLLPEIKDATSGGKPPFLTCSW